LHENWRAAKKEKSRGVRIQHMSEEFHMESLKRRIIMYKWTNLNIAKRQNAATKKQYDRALENNLEIAMKQEF